MLARGDSKRYIAPEGNEVVMDAHPKDCQTVEAEANTGVVNDADIQVARIGTKGPFVIFADDFGNEGGKSEYRFNLHIL